MTRWRLWFAFWLVANVALCVADAASGHWAWATLAAFWVGCSFVAMVVELVDPV